MRLSNNIPALDTYTSLLRTGRKVDSSMRKLSSGYRINSVADDAAGMAISHKMRDQILRLDMASRNSMDSISLIQTADGAFAEIHDMVHRIRELAVQASNGTMMPEDRRKCDEEVQSLLAEIDGITNRTEFNKIKILNGDAERLTRITDQAGNASTKATIAFVSDEFPVTPNDGRDYAGSDGLKFDVNTLGQPASFTMVDLAALSTTLTQSTVDGLVGQSLLMIGAHPIVSGGTPDPFAEGISVESGDTPTTLIDKIKELIDRCGAVFDKDDPTYVYTKECGESIHMEPTGGLAAFFNMVPVQTNGTNADVTGAIYNGANLTATADGNRLSFVDSNNNKIIVDLNVKYDTAGQEMVFRQDGSTDAIGGADGLRIAVLNYGQLKFQIGPNKDMNMDAAIPKLNLEAMGIQNMAVLTLERSQKAIIQCDKADAFLSSRQSILGAYQNRLEHTVRSVDTTAENTRQALSRIYDTDMAKEIMLLTQNQIITQAGMSIMAQANARGQQFLQILG